MSTSKIFGIGLSRTGTTSLTKALNMLGISTIHYPLRRRDFDTHDAATDVTVSAYFKRLDQLFSGSKFIYTTREIDEWLESCRAHWERTKVRKLRTIEIAVRKRLYNCLEFDREKFRVAYWKHDRRVRDYFKERRDDLLILDICGRRASWDDLCDFLKRPVPDVAFPYENTRSSAEELIKRLAHVIDDPQQVARLVHLPRAYVEQVIAAGDAAAVWESQLGRDDEGYIFTESMPRICAHFGGPGAAADRLNISGEIVRRALGRIRRTSATSQ